jgi:hypothetical protein
MNFTLIKLGDTPCVVAGIFKQSCKIIDMKHSFTNDTVYENIFILLRENKLNY